MNTLTDTPIVEPKAEFAKILIVDDRRENLYALKKLLKPMNIEIVEALSGNEALTKMLNEAFACVLLDVQMPEMDGFEVAGIVRDVDSMKDTPIIFVTAISKEEHFVNKAAVLGAVDYIFKPINANILRSKVQVYVDLYEKQQQLKLKNEQLNEKNEELVRFSYICSHDLQEPARIVSSFSGLLASQFSDQLSDEAHKYLAYIRRNSDHMLAMIKDILTFSRIGHEGLVIESVDTELLASEVISEFKDIIDEVGAEVRLGYLPTIEANKTLLHMLLHNLIANALKFHKPDVAPVVVVDCDLVEDFYKFKVSDNGIGIDSKYKDKVFAMFERIHRRDIYPGTGIGLCSCQKFLKHYNGRLWYESVVNRGSDFFFTIPISAKKPAGEARL